MAVKPAATSLLSTDRSYLVPDNRELIDWPGIAFSYNNISERLVMEEVNNV
jgi:hypothetical protein